MVKMKRREVLGMLLTAPFMGRVTKAEALLAQVTASPAQHVAGSPPGDWSVALVESTLRANPSAKDFGTWGYAKALYLYGQYLVYLRSRDKRYLDYIQDWVDAHVDAGGKIDKKLDALDYMLPGNLLLVLYKETKLPKYRLAAESIRTRLDTYPRTEDGAFWHATSRQHQLWLDGMYMSMPFLVRYGEMFNDQKYAYDEAANQLLIYAKHLNDPVTGLMFHAYDESGQQPWADPVTHHSAIFWCRAIGWFGMALIEVLQTMPHTHPKRGALIAQLHQMVVAYGKYQDPATGRWYQVVDQPTPPGNWLETSSSCMYTYTISRAVERGYVEKKHAATACKGVKGVLTQLTLDADGNTQLANICEGTNVSDLAYYLARPRNTNDFHGLGAFLIMNEQLRMSPCAGEMHPAHKHHV